MFLQINGSTDAGFPTALRSAPREQLAGHKFASPLSSDRLEWHWLGGLRNVWGMVVPNRNADLCSYQEVYPRALSSLLQKPLELYEFFFFVNCGVRGPFFELDVHSATPTAEEWLARFTDKLSPTVLLVGPTVSCQVRSAHVQTYAIAMKQSTYQWFADEAWGRCTEKTKDDIIIDSEVGLSSRILNAGFTLGSLMPRHNGISSHFTTYLDSCPNHNPTLEPLEPYEVVFVKYGGQIFRNARKRNMIHWKTSARVEEATQESGRLLDVHTLVQQHRSVEWQTSCPESADGRRLASTLLQSIFLSKRVQQRVSVGVAVRVPEEGSRPVMQVVMELIIAAQCAAIDLLVIVTVAETESSAVDSFLRDLAVQVGTLVRPIFSLSHHPIASNSKRTRPSAQTSCIP